ncbi:hypothetical protein FGG08_005569 [Glutinoglossum americanum]|uniref:AAA+ ATPase domain-containing protein n=1 Tax=Glutinoglossum americanum TaxID=1670608 RepID=A0A9P8I963_9PEZI|nr:hypothetical protein FGG08_005569 [Glutinoglossum americanum]
MGFLSKLKLWRKPKAPMEPEGMKCSIKNLYYVSQRPGHGYWADKMPKQIPEPMDTPENAQFALVVKQRPGHGGKKKFEIDSILIQSPLLKNALDTVLKGFPGVTPGLSSLTFTPPFKPLFYRWDELVKAVEEEENPVTKKHLDLFFSIVEPELKDTIKVRDEFVAHGVVTFQHIWTIFPAGTMIFTTQDDQECAYKLNNSMEVQTTCGKFYQLECENVDWDGQKFGKNHRNLMIPYFPGTHPISELNAFPLEYHPEHKVVKERLLDRGKRFEQLHGQHYKMYKGIALGKPMWGRKTKYNINGRIIIDTHSFNRFNPDMLVSVQDFEGAAAPTSTEIPDDSSSYDSDTTTGEIDGDHQRVPVTKLTDEQLIMTTTIVRGYALKDKKWASFYVNSISEIQFSETAFDSLVLPGARKELILAFAESQLKCKKTFDDVIQGKGKGIIMLLSGPPGVGKTLTAESVAETMHAPLYTMSAGDLGLAPEDIETKLSEILEMATRWKAVLLLDEADVFLEQRTLNDLERNKLVSIFLRILEYYEGILFLTTNRVQTFDAAFQSRIHITINYPDLTSSSRRLVWSTFLAASNSPQSLSDEEIDGLAELPMNGRQIKNVVKTALLLAARKNVPLDRGHIENVLTITQGIEA